MKKIKRGCYNQTVLFILLIGIAFLFQNCQKDDLINSKENQIPTHNSLKSSNDKVMICHYSKSTNTWDLITVSKSALNDHLSHHLDVIIDQDGDGYAAFNECGYLNEQGIDCNDQDKSIYPGSAEICSDEIDNDCNGKVDDCEIKTYVPDDNFEQALIDKGYDDIIDNYVLTKNINTIVDLDIANRKIADLTGIEDFSALKNLYCDHNLFTQVNLSANKVLSFLNCSYNQLTQMDLSSNKSLMTLICAYNLITALDMSANILLYKLHCYNNKIVSLDLSNNTALGELWCSRNNMTALNISNSGSLSNLICNENNLSNLNISNNVALKFLYCDVNQLNNIDVSKNIALQTLNVGRNQISNIDISNNINLSSFTCSNNKLASIDVSKNILLTSVSCGTNQITRIDVSKNLALKELHIDVNEIADIDISSNKTMWFFTCSENLLTKLDVSANNLLTNLSCISNSFLSCIQVNSTQLSAIPASWKKDGAASYSLNCSN